MSNLSKETTQRISDYAYEKGVPLKVDEKYKQGYISGIIDGALHEAGRAQQEIAQLKQWKAEASGLLNPILDYGQSKKAGIPLGESITATVLERCKGFHVAQQEIESLTNQLKGHASVSNENMKLLRQENEQYKAMVKEYGELSDKIFKRDKEIESIQAKLEKYEKALKEIIAMDGHRHGKFDINKVANEALSGEGKEVEKPMQYNTCKTCGANNGRAGMLINDDCLNCHETRKTGAVTIHTNLERTQGEIDKTIGILNQKEVK